MVTIQKIKEVKPVDSDYELAIVNDKEVLVEWGLFEEKHWVLLKEGNDETSLHSIFLLNDVYPEEEMVLGGSTATGKIQLGPYDDALIIEEGVDVTDLVKKLIK